MDIHRVRVRVRNINLKGLFQFMSLTSENWKLFCNSFLYEKRTVNSGIELLTSNLQLSTQSTKPLSHVQKTSLRLIQILRFLNLNVITIWMQQPWSNHLWVSLEGLPTFSRPCLPPLQNRSHSTTLISMKKESSALGLNPCLLIPSSAHYPVNHRSIWNKRWQ